MSDLKAVIVQCGNEEYAIAVDTVVSIERLEQVNPIPHLTRLYAWVNAHSGRTCSYHRL